MDSSGHRLTAPRQTLQPRLAEPDSSRQTAAGEGRKGALSRDKAAGPRLSLLAPEFLSPAWSGHGSGPGQRQHNAGRLRTRRISPPWRCPRRPLGLQPGCRRQLPPEGREGGTAQPPGTSPRSQHMLVGHGFLAPHIPSIWPGFHRSSQELPSLGDTLPTPQPLGRSLCCQPRGSQRTLLPRDKLPCWIRAPQHSLRRDEPAGDPQRPRPCRRPRLGALKGMSPSPPTSPWGICGEAGGACRAQRAPPAGLSPIPRGLHSRRGQPVSQGAPKLPPGWGSGERGQEGTGAFPATAGVPPCWRGSEGSGLGLTL